MLTAAPFTCNVILCGTKTLSRRSSTLITPEYFRNTLASVVKLGPKFGFTGGHFENVTPKHVVVEYSSPNVAKKFHVGHFRSTIIGQAVSNIIEASGNEVTRINYLGDWGMQFAILATGFEKYGDEEMLIKSPLRHLFDVYVKANEDIRKDYSAKQRAQEIFLQLENQDPKAMALWKLCRDMSLKEYKKLYQSINVIFDSYESESMYHHKCQNVLTILRKHEKFIKQENGTECMELSGTSWQQLDGNLTSLYPAVARSNGTSLYLTRDIAAAISRHEKYNFDQMIYVTDKYQWSHFQQLFGVLEVMGHRWAKKECQALHHVGFGRVIGMKTRTGDVVFLEDLLQETYDRVEAEQLEHSTSKTDIEQKNEMIHILGLSGLICCDLKPKICNDYKFSWSSALQSKGYTGIFLQYTHCRLASLKRNSGITLNMDTDCSTLTNETTAVKLILHLLKFNDSAWKAYSELEPSYLTNYMLQLSHLIAKAYRELRIIGEPDDVAQPRLLLFHCAQIVLQSCMETVGLHPLEKM